MAVDLEVQVKEVAGALIVWVSGEADQGTSVALRDALQRLAEKARERIVVELSGVSFLDSSGLSALIAGYKTAMAAGRGFSVVGLVPQVARMFKITAIDTMITVHHRLRDALSSSDESAGYEDEHDLEGRVPLLTYLARPDPGLA